MSKRKKRIDTGQLSFEFDKKIDEYINLRKDILTPHPPQPHISHSWEEDCIETAASAKRAIKQSGMSRDEVVDAVNSYYGWHSPAGTKTGKALSIHMFNHYLSKPTRYHMPAYLIFAIQHVTGSLSISEAHAAAEDARVITGNEVRQMTLGKLDETIIEMQRLKKELRGTGRR